MVKGILVVVRGIIFSVKGILISVRGILISVTETNWNTVRWNRREKMKKLNRTLIKLEQKCKHLPSSFGM